jgi:hypothetical protein
MRLISWTLRSGSEQWGVQGWPSPTENVEDGRSLPLPPPRRKNSWKGTPALPRLPPLPPPDSAYIPHSVEESGFWYFSPVEGERGAEWRAKPKGRVPWRCVHPRNRPQDILTHTKHPLNFPTSVTFYYCNISSPRHFTTVTFRFRDILRLQHFDNDISR